MPARRSRRRGVEFGVRHARSKSRVAELGDVVVFDYGGGLMITGTAVEDRGYIGAGGRRLVRVRIEMEPGVEPMFIELPDAALTIVKRARSATGR